MYRTSVMNFELDGHFPVRWVCQLQQARSMSAFPTRIQPACAPTRNTHTHTHACAQRPIHVKSSSVFSAQHDPLFPPSPRTGREMWYRGSLAWHEILTRAPPPPPGRGGTNLLVVAHNNFNQALLAAALGLPATYFRRLVQDNAAVSSMLLEPAGQDGTPPKARA